MICYRQRGKKLSPWTVINIMARARAGERSADLAEEFGVNRATINRWIHKWGQEADLVEQIKANRKSSKRRQIAPQAATA